VSEITDAISEVKRMRAVVRRAEKERKEINDVAKKQRAEIRRLKRLLKEAYDRIPMFFDKRNDKLFDDIDAALYKEEL